MVELDPNPDETHVGIVEGRRERKSGKEEPPEVEEFFFFFVLAQIHQSSRVLGEVDQETDAAPPWSYTDGK